MTLDELRERANGCTTCAIASRRTNVVFGEGNPQSPLVLVGEGPGEEEDRTGRPFVGRAGKMLDQALADNGLSRQDVYICNTLKCRACEWTGDRARNRPPTPEEVLNCRQWLVPQLAALAPRAILCVGAPSAKNLIKPDFKITVERGKYFPCEFAKVAIATLHPAYVMRQQSATSDGGYSLIVSDIGRAWACALQLSEKAGV
ncbi:MAG: uracil-DNA glycosylase [Fimbriimonadaceae bacterium]